MDKLSTPARIILGIASISLIVLYFVPIWRIDLFAPQYPEGLTMKIWIDTLKGDIDIINGLNHYIGMRHISVEMFPEFDFLKFIVAFYILLGLAVAILGNRKILLWYLVFTAFGGLFAAYDFYRWGYEYGHNLDPTAPIKVPGLSYQPPMLGHKRLLNFDAYSFPDVGGWVLFVAVGIFVAVWIQAKFKERKRFKTKTTAAVVTLSFMLASCSAEQEPIKFGTDVCAHCKMGIADLKFGGELVTTKGKIYKFDDVICMTTFMKSDEVKDVKMKYVLVVDHGSGGKLIDATKAVYIRDQQIRAPMNSETAAFSNENHANSFLPGKNTLKWMDVVDVKYVQ